MELVGLKLVGLVPVAIEDPIDGSGLDVEALVEGEWVAGTGRDRTRNFVDSGQTPSAVDSSVERAVVDGFPIGK